jgi:hypothetical protein
VLSLMLITLIAVQPASAATPESYLTEAKRLVANLAASANADTVKTIAALNADLDDLAAAYLAQTKRAAATGVEGAVGTSGSASAPGDLRSGGDWRTRYATVERDFTTVLPRLDDDARRQLEMAHHRLQLFYTATLGPTRDANPVAHIGADEVAPTAAAPQTEPAQRAPGSVDPDRATMLMLLERMEKLVTDPLSGGKDGKVTIDRSALDEIIAEIAQIKTILRRNGG